VGDAEAQLAADIHINEAECARLREALDAHVRLRAAEEAVESRVAALCEEQMRVAALIKTTDEMLSSAATSATTTTSTTATSTRRPFIVRPRALSSVADSADLRERAGGGGAGAAQGGAVDPEYRIDLSGILSDTSSDSDSDLPDIRSLPVGGATAPPPSSSSRLSRSDLESLGDVSWSSTSSESS